MTNKVKDIDIKNYTEKVLVSNKISFGEKKNYKYLS